MSADTMANGSDSFVTRTFVQSRADFTVSKLAEFLCAFRNAEDLYAGLPRPKEDEAV
jgi:hypothetical protein